MIRATRPLRAQMAAVPIHNAGWAIGTHADCGELSSPPVRYCALMPSSAGPDFLVRNAG
jgi:hypothetical protein